MGYANEKGSPDEASAPSEDAENADDATPRAQDPSAAASPSTASDARSSLDLSRTLPTGASFHATWRMPAVRLHESPAHEPHESGVRKLELAEGAVLIPPSQSAALASEDANRARTSGHKVTLTSLVPPAPEGNAAPRSEPSPSAPPHSPSTSLQRTLGMWSTPPTSAPLDGHATEHAIEHAGSEGPDLGRTLRMDFSVDPAVARAIEEAAARTASENAPSPTRAQARSEAHDANVHAAQVRRVGAHVTLSESARPASMRATDPMGLPVPSLPPETAAPKNAPSTGKAAATTDAEAPRDASARKAADGAARRAPKRDPFRFVDEHGKRYEPEPTAPRRKELSRNDKIVAVLVGAALMSTLFMFFVEPSAHDDEEIIEAPETYAKPNGPREHIVLPAGQTPATAGENRAKPEALGPGLGATTEIVSTPSGAEIVLGGAVIANTPARLPRASYEADYVVRLPGHGAQLLRIGPSSPETIAVTLVPDARETRMKEDGERKSETPHVSN